MDCASKPSQQALTSWLPTIIGQRQMRAVRFITVLSLVFTSSGAFVVHTPSPTTIKNATPFSTLFSTINVGVVSDSLAQTLKKPSKTLSVVLGCDCGERCDDGDLETLSMQLRKIKASALVTSSVDVAKAFVDEQSSAVGNFPGPCPILFSGEDIEGALQVGVSAVIVREYSGLPSSQSFDNVLRLETPEDVHKARTNAFLVDGDNEKLQEILANVPSNAVVIAEIEAMQHENKEIQRGKDLRELGVSSILVKGACVGDGEDLDYSSFVVDGLTRKKSSSFNMSGLTGSANGHFGGIASSQPTTWRRKVEEE